MREYISINKEEYEKLIESQFKYYLLLGYAIKENWITDIEELRNALAIDSELLKKRSM